MFKNNNLLFAIIKIFLLLVILLSINSCLFIQTGGLYITSSPSGAAIYLDGGFTGKYTPATISDLTLGSHLLELVIDEPFVKVEKVLVVFKNQFTTAHIELSTQKVYRALCIGVNEYQDPGILDLRAPSFDVDRIRQVFKIARFGEGKTEFDTINTLIGTQATRSNILHSIESTFSNVDSNDVSYFYFSGHGWSDGDTSTLLPYDALAENDSQDISVNELVLSLGNVPGTKVVILDSCYSGGFIGREYLIRKRSENVNLRQYNENIIESFVGRELSCERGNLATNGFKVIVSAAGEQKCWETTNYPIDGNPYGYFSATLSEGCGYNNFNFPFPADVNKDASITLNELYEYIKTTLQILNQDVQVYPQNSPYLFIEY